MNTEHCIHDTEYTKTLYISGNFERTKNADHFLEMAGLGQFRDYRFIIHICF